VPKKKKKNLHIRLFRIQIIMHIETRKYVHTHKKKVFEHLQWCSVCVRDSLQKYIYLFHIQVLVILLFCNPTCWKEGDALKASNPSSSIIIIIIIIRWYFLSLFSLVMMMITTNFYVCFLIWGVVGWFNAAEHDRMHQRAMSHHDTDPSTVFFVPAFRPRPIMVLNKVNFL